MPLSEFFFSKIAGLTLVITLKNDLFHMYFSRTWNRDIEAQIFRTSSSWLLAAFFIWLITLEIQALI